MRTQAYCWAAAESAATHHKQNGTLYVQSDGHSKGVSGLGEVGTTVVLISEVSQYI
jgi:hypothetical protein